MASAASLDECMSVGDLRIRIAEELDHDIEDPVDTVGNGRVAGAFRKQTLRSIAFRIPDRRGDARDFRTLTSGDLRTYIARQLDTDPPARHYTWSYRETIHLTITGGEAAWLNVFVNYKFHRIIFQ